MQGDMKDFNVSNIVDERPVQALTFLVLGLCFLANVSDGYNLGAVGIAAPGIVKTLGTTRAGIAPFFSAALFGMLVISIDGIQLQEFDFVDIGTLLEGSGSLPVVVKSLVFPGGAQQ